MLSEFLLLVLTLMFCAIAASTMSAGNGGGIFDILLESPESRIARIDFDFKLTFFMIGALVVGVLGYAVFQAGVEEPIYRSETQAIPIEQHKSNHRVHKPHVHHLVAVKK
ncbi:hypothetical protein BH10CYA1_BH10CYA1_28260 [soil metagenome]